MITNTKRHAMIAQALIVFERSKSEMRFSVAPVGSSSMYACKSGDRRWPKPACWIFSGRRCRCSTTPLEFAAASRTNLSGSSLRANQASRRWRGAPEIDFHPGNHKYRAYSNSASRVLRRFCFAYLATVSSNSALFVAFWSETMASGERMLRLVERRRLRSGGWRAVARQGSSAARARMSLALRFRNWLSPT